MGLDFIFVFVFILQVAPMELLYIVNSLLQTGRPSGAGVFSTFFLQMFCPSGTDRVIFCFSTSLRDWVLFLCCRSLLRSLFILLMVCYKQVVPTGLIFVFMFQAFLPDLYLFSFHLSVHVYVSIVRIIFTR